MIRALIYDLDGVITDTAVHHFQSWKWLAGCFKLDLDPELNQNLKGVGRKESLDLILKWAGVELDEDEKKHWMEQKNRQYLKRIQTMGPSDLFDGFVRCHDHHRSRGYKTAIGSSSKNAAVILDKLQLCDTFDAVSDGTMSARSKPAPDIFVKAAELLYVPPRECAVFEDSQAGIDAALAAGMTAISFGTETLDRAHYHLESWDQWDPNVLERLK